MKSCLLLIRLCMTLLGALAIAFLWSSPVFAASYLSQQMPFVLQQQLLPSVFNQPAGLILRGTVNFTYVSLPNTTAVPRTSPQYGCATMNCDAVSIHVRTPLVNVQRNERLTYTITVRNDSSYAQSPRVLAILDDAVFFESASGQWQQNGTVLTWDALRVAPGQSLSLTVRVHVRPEARTRQEIRFTAQADRVSDTLTTRVIDSYEENGVIQYDTGDSYFTPYGVPTGRPPRFPFYSTRYRYDRYGNPEYSENYRRNTPYYSCDPTRYTCQY